MRVKSVKLKSFKRFEDLVIGPISDTARLVLILGPNGSGKSSLLEAFNHWHAFRGWRSHAMKDFVVKAGGSLETGFGDWYSRVVEVELHEAALGQQQMKSACYFRSAYRHEADFTTQQLSRSPLPFEQPRTERFIASDSVVSKNYMRLVERTVTGVYEAPDQHKTIAELREELVGRIRDSLRSVFPDLTLTSVGEPLRDGTFLFTKGSSEHFRYKNLSAGEKSVFDLILDLVVNLEHYPRSLFFIDEPEAHIHTATQGATLRTLYELIPAESQLWCSTHSLGMLLEAYRLEEQNPGTVAFLDMSNRDFDVAQELRPSSADRQLWQKCLEIALGTIGEMVGPKVVYACEGDPNSHRNDSFDAQVLTRIFGNSYPTVAFVSVGSADQVSDPNNVAVRSLEAIFPGCEVRRFVDRDDRNDHEVRELGRRGVLVSTERHMESYLLSDELIGALCNSVGRPELVPQALEIKRNALALVAGQGYPPDDMKSASGAIVVGLRRLLALGRSGQTTHAFLRDTMAPLVKRESATFQLLVADLRL